MRLLFGRVRYRGIEDDLNVIKNILCSSAFIFLDVFFWSLILAMLTFSLHQSLVIGGLVFMGAYTFGLCLFLLLKKWLGDQPD